MPGSPRTSGGSIRANKVAPSPPEVSSGGGAGYPEVASPGAGYPAVDASAPSAAGVDAMAEAERAAALAGEAFQMAGRAQQVRGGRVEDAAAGVAAAGVAACCSRLPFPSHHDAPPSINTTSLQADAGPGGPRLQPRGGQPQRRARLPAARGRRRPRGGCPALVAGARGGRAARLWPKQPAAVGTDQCHLRRCVRRAAALCAELGCAAGTLCLTVCLLTSPTLARPPGPANVTISNTTYAK